MKKILLALLCCCIGFTSHAQFKNHGPQVFAKAVQGSHFIQDKQGKQYLFTVVRGIPARLLGYQLADGKKIVDVPLPGTDGSWDMCVASDNTLYATGNGKVYAYTLGDANIKDLGLALPQQKVIWDLHADSKGGIYGGTYPDGRIFYYHPKSGFQEVSQGPVYAGENYTRSVVYDKKADQIYTGTGSNAKFIRLDTNTGQKQQLLASAPGFKEFVYDLDIQENIHKQDYILGYINSNADTKTFVYSIQQDKIVAELPPIEIKSIARDAKSTKIYYTAKSKIYQLDLGELPLAPKELASIKGSGKTGLMLKDGSYQVFTNAQFVYRVNPKTKKLTSQELQVPNSPILIQSIFWGPDNKIWSAGYLAGQHGSFDPKTGEHQEYPGLHQTEGLNSQGNKLYFGIYTKANIYSYDVTQPWKVGTENPKFIGQIKDQDRPFAVISMPDRQEMVFGTVPPYGKLGGSIAHVHTKTNKLTSFDQVIPNQSIISLLNVDGRVIGGSSIAGGLGATPTSKRGYLFEWDPENKKVLWKDSIADYWSVSGLFLGPDKRVWGFADGTLIEYDLQQKKLLTKVPVYTYERYPSHIWRNGLGVYHPNGLIYFTLSDSFYCYNPKTKNLTKLKDEASLMILGKDNKLYFKHGTDLWSYTPEQ